MFHGNMPRLVHFVRGGAALALVTVAWLGLGLPAAGMLLGTRAPPTIAPPPVHGITLEQGRRTWGSSFRESIGRLTHVHLDGDPVAIGTAHGLLAGDLITALEGDMTGTFVERIPSFAARHLILGLVAWNNRALMAHFTPEELTELAASTAAHGARWDSRRSLGPSFNRGLQYHALHDVSQYLIDNPLVRPIQVGCTALAVGGQRTIDGHLLVGRLFDFEGGPRFDDDKIVFTVRPTEGIPFVHVCWAGMSGAVTGMNQAGLWVSINAGATTGQGFVGRPIVMVVRQILQHCRSIDEAVAVIRDSPVFVADGVLLASRDEQRVVVAEKGPTGLFVRPWAEERLVSTNHFLADGWATDPRNQERIAQGTTTVRMQRVEELLALRPRHDPGSLLEILRDHAGLGGRPVGFNNRSTINAWIGAHLVVADVTRGILWVSEPSHGLGLLRPFTVDGPVDLPPLPASPELPRLADKATYEATRDALLQDLHQPQARDLAARLEQLNPEGFEAAWLAGLVASNPGERETKLRRALTLQPAYPADVNAIRSALAGGTALPVSALHQ